MKHLVTGLLIAAGLVGLAVAPVWRGVLTPPEWPRATRG